MQHRRACSYTDARAQKDSARVRARLKGSEDIRPTPHRAAEDAATPFANAGTCRPETDMRLKTKLLINLNHSDSNEIYYHFRMQSGP